MKQRTLLDVLLKQDKGFGDTVSRTIKTVTRGKVKECGGCSKRKQFLNKYIPYGKLKS